jgi:hypothetical protein
MDAVFIIVAIPNFPMSAGVVPRAVAKMLLRQHSPDKIKVSEIDPLVKSEYNNFFKLI